MSWLIRLFRRSSAPPSPATEPEAAGGTRADAWQPTPRQDLGWRTDAWQDPSTGLGTTRDGRLWATFVADLVTAQQAAELVRGDGLAAKLVEDIVDEAFRIGFDLEIKERDQTRGSDGHAEAADDRRAEDLQADVLAAWNNLDVMAKLGLAEKMDRQDGGAAILLGLNDLRTTPEQAPKANAKLEWLRVVHPSRLRPYRRYSNPYAAKCGEVELWQLIPEAVAGMSEAPSAPIFIHEERVIIFSGVRTAGDVYVRYEYDGFGDSVLTRAKAAIRRFCAALDGIELTARRNGEPWWKVKNLAELLAKDKGDGFKKRLAAKEKARGTLKLNVIDSEDEFGMAAAPLTGLKEIVETFKDELAAITGMPRVRLFGESPAGLSDGTKGPQRIWYDAVAAWASVKAVPPLVRITRWIMNGLGGEALEWKITPTDPWQMSEKERAELDKLDAETDAVLIQATVITGRDARRREKWQLRYKLEQEDDTADLVPPDDIRDLPPGAATGPDGTGAGGGPELQKTALNGAQVQSLLEVVRAVASGEISAESGVEIILGAFPQSYDRAAAQRLVSKGFKAEPKPAPAPFGGQPGAPATAAKAAKGEPPPAAKPTAGAAESKP